jgi:integrase
LSPKNLSSNANLQRLVQAIPDAALCSAQDFSCPKTFVNAQCELLFFALHMKIKFTKCSIAKLSCNNTQGRLSVRDTDCRGLCLEVRSTGGKTYFLSYRDTQGRQRSFKLANAADVSVQQARQLCERARTRVAMGEELKSPPAPQVAIAVDVVRAPTLNTFFEKRYLPFIKSNNSSGQSDVSLYKNHIKSILGKLRMNEITYEHIGSVIVKAKTTLAHSTCNRLVVLMRYIFNLAIKWEIPGVIKNPTANYSIKQPAIYRERYLSAEEVQRLLAELNCSLNRQLKYIVPFLLLTGARKTEVLTARWSDIDFERKFWRIPISKNGRARHVPLSAAAVALLQSIPNKSNALIFANPETDKAYASIYVSWNTARTRAGLADVRMHDLRHSFASFLVNAGCSLYEVQRILGHSQIKVTQRYSHLSQESLLRAAECAGGVVMPVELVH